METIRFKVNGQPVELQIDASTPLLWAIREHLGLTGTKFGCGRNRTASPDLFADDILGHAPHIGRLYRQSPVPDTRRVLLKGTRYHVYYVARRDQVIVLAVWHGQRGVGPPLRVS
jgi:hypothetical protein